MSANNWIKKKGYFILKNSFGVLPIGVKSWNLNGSQKKHLTLSISDFVTIGGFKVSILWVFLFQIVKFEIFEKNIFHPLNNKSWT